MMAWIIQSFGLFYFLLFFKNKYYYYCNPVWWIIPLSCDIMSSPRVIALFVGSWSMYSFIPWTSFIPFMKLKGKYWPVPATTVLKLLLQICVNGKCQQGNEIIKRTIVKPCCFYKFPLNSVYNQGTKYCN